MCLSLWVYGWLGINQRNIIAWKRRIYSNLNIEDITDADYMHAKKKVCKNFEIKKIRLLLWFLSWTWYTTFGWCFSKL